ncbi:hypothetical protein DFP72DRAFT_1075733 [Ephemerocybe angulata]|uniref:Uncharacterized protein n=1 Tax=Ephemerocybe angulata TaxID=980116 RepID=A0A8H6HHH4_9AGAR|nr:hypothetical protein DFP72DRAFT_1075733 [Tulosesus angulatus]
MPNKCHITDEEVEMYMKTRKYNAAGRLICPRCFKSYPEGTGGPKNILKTHVGSENCVKRGGTIKNKESVQKSSAFFKNFFTVPSTKKKTVPTTATAPKIIPSHVAPKLHWNTLNDSRMPDSAVATEPTHIATPSSIQTNTNPTMRNTLAHLASRLPAPSLDATPNPFLAEFDIPPASYDNPSLSADDLWEESLNKLLHGAFGWGEGPYQEQMVGLVPERVLGVVRFVEYFVDVRGLSEALFEARMSRLIESIEKWGDIQEPAEQEVQPVNTAPAPPPCQERAFSDPIEILSDAESVTQKVQSTRAVPAIHDRVSHSHRCAGYKLDIPGHGSPTSMYPFGLHDEIDLPWDFAVQNGRMTLTARLCEGMVRKEGEACRLCWALKGNNVLKGVVERMRTGVKEGTKYAYYGAGGLQRLLREKNKRVEFYRLRALSNARRLTAKATALDDHKRFLTAVASKRVEHVDRIIRLGLRHGRGIRSMLEQCMKAAEGIYKPKSFEEVDYMRGLVLWKLGGNRVASIAHRSLGLPSITTLKNQVRIPPILLSARQPTTAEVSKNVEMSFDGMEEAMKPVDGARNNHAVLMFDEIATEKRLRYDSKTDFVVGICREHADNVPPEFRSAKDVEEVFTKVKEGKAHIAGEVSGERNQICFR